MTAEAAVSPPRLVPSGRRLDRTRYSKAGSLLLLPSIALIAAGFLWPVIYSIYLGLTNVVLVGPTAIHYSFTGLTNVRTAINDDVFRRSLELTAVFTGSAVVFAPALGLGLALLMREVGGAVRGLVGSLVMIAWVLPPVTTAILWLATTTQGGTLGALIGSSTTDVLNQHPLLVVCLANIWTQIGLAMLTMSAALRNVPPEITEAAALEGAGPVRRFTAVVIPHLKPTIMVTALLVGLLSIGNFALVFVLTNGGPNDATNILPVYSYQEAFVFFKLGYGAMLGNVLVIIAGIVGILYVRATRSAAS